MWKRGVALACGMAAMMMEAFPAGAQEHLPVLEPSSPWEVNYADDSCLARRMFGTPGNEVYFELRRFSPDSQMQLTVARENMTKGALPVRYRFGTNGEWREVSNAFGVRLQPDLEGFLFAGSLLPEPEDSTKVDLSIVDPELPDRLAAAFARADAFSIDGGFDHGFTLHTGHMLAVHRAMETCLEKLLASWNLDADAHKTLTRKAAPKDMKQVLRNLTFPPAMQATPKRKVGVVRFRLSISESGAVTDCRIQWDISDPAFERETCRGMRKSKFIPALDKDGRPIASYFANGVQFTLP